MRYGSVELVVSRLSRERLAGWAALIGNASLIATFSSFFRNYYERISLLFVTHI